MELKSVRLEIPEGGNIIVGQTHFIKTVEDIYEAIVNSVPQIKFGIAFNEASGPCLTRADGNDADLKALAIRNASALAAGHVFVVAMRDGYPINVLGRIKDVPEVRSEEHTSELQSRRELVCRLLREKKNADSRGPLACLSSRRACAT